MRYRSVDLEEFASEVLQAVGVWPQHALMTAKALIDAGLEGHEGHGLDRLPMYVKKLQAGLINPKAIPTIARRFPSAILLDGQNGLGQVVGVMAMELAIESAKEIGFSVVGVKNSNHFGVTSYYCKKAVEKDMIGLTMTNSAPGIPPWGGRRVFFGTNPIAFACPAAKYPPVVIDLATSVAARGKIILAAKNHKEIPSGWALNREGVPTVDPREALEGVLLPMAGPKGYALALLVEILTGALTGAGIGPEVGSIFGDQTVPSNTGHFFAAIQIEAFMPIVEFRERIDRMIREIKDLDPAPGFSSILIPGERRFEEAQKRLEKGIPLEKVLAEELTNVGKDLDIAFPQAMR